MLECDQLDCNERNVLELSHAKISMFPLTGVLCSWRFFKKKHPTQNWDVNVYYNELQWWNAEEITLVQACGVTMGCMGGQGKDF